MTQDHPIPLNDSHRIAVLESYDILDTEFDERFDRITRLAARYFNVPIAVVSLIDSDRQWFKSCVGLDAREMPREMAFCAHAIMESKPLVVQDATKDPRFASNPLVTGDTQVGFYAGAPFTVPEGVRIGTLCIVDTKPRFDFGADETAILEDLSALIVDALVDWRRSREALTDLGDELSRARANAKSAARSKQEFLDVVSHELRTPLTAILGFGQLIADKPDIGSGERREYAGFICSAGERLHKIVDTVMTFSQIERGELELHDDIFLVKDALNASAEMLDLEARQRGITLDVDRVAPDAQLCLLGDRLHIEQVLMQILDNALRFSPDNSRVTMTAHRDTDGRLRIDIGDEGPGIERKDHAAALESFRQLSEGLDRKHNGFGLGLPISQKLMQLHGGRLEIGARPGGGTIVSIILPAYRVGDQATEKSATGAAG